ncbi:integral membrane protein associated with nucleod distribution YlmG [Thermosynechococcus sp. NK55a]|jgi:YggT family protein|uniref:YggT family protein n=1 Tax=unclassified Thermosynechococcus TaxID=2622553 RepID=UPI0003D8DDA1|nr:MULTISPECIES: YggT family protein [unclassified Thermosynechococcus]AHB89571.1 integral membrane protein associated with nucleod distribution YlmG [Thermosynechococcus sp. NK55a]RMH66072.1 MAG: YggT family protein [Cyanobacteria bacterium J003]HIK23238.1 YggT family protein [Thermosynechococcus sp. M3746_W2019_013]
MTEAAVLPILLMGIANFLQIYLIILLIRVLLSWFPNINWYNSPFSILSQLTDPYLNIFRGLIPPIGGLDFSPIIAFFLLQFIVQLLAGFSSSATFF